MEKKANTGSLSLNWVNFHNFDGKLSHVMNIRSHLCILILAIFLGEPLFAQKEVYSGYYLIRRKYENRLENDPSALPLIRQLIHKAKGENKYAQLFQGYNDGIRWSSCSKDKLKYADSVIWAAKSIKDNDTISKAYLAKGVVYYFNFKRYKLALDEYLKAYEYAKKSNDEFHKNRLAYLIGVVKSYIGYYSEALIQFDHTRTFFEKESKKGMHPNLIYGNLRGYYNSLHQMTICYRNLGDYKSADSIINIGLAGTANKDDYQQEYGYFLKEKGIRQFCKKEYRSSIRSLKSSLVLISGVNDFAWMTVCYSYIGKSYMEIDDPGNALRYFRKVDSIFQKHDFTLPELRNNYERLIDYYKKEKDISKELFYTNQLLKADNVINRDFANLSSKIHKEYDTSALQEGKSRLENQVSRVAWIMWTLASIAAGLLVILLFKHYAERKNRERYRLLEQKILNKDNFPAVQAGAKGNHNLEIEQKILEEILLRLQKFEESLGFVENGLTLHKLATRLDTNYSYLSQIVNEYKGVSFTRYLSELRIRYITDKLYNDKKYLNYTIETLAEECGMASRTNFSNLFQEINGIRPTDFIKQRLQDTEEKQQPKD